MRKIGVLSVLIAVMAAIASASASNSEWKIFSSGAGWRMNYPADWQVEICQNCRDLAIVNAFVNFFPAAQLEPDGSVIVETLPSKPTEVGVDEWLATMPTAGGHNPLRSETRITLNGSPALKVRYLDALGHDRESVYVVVGLETFRIEFSAERSHMPLRYLMNYPTYLRMLDTFQVIN
jgi:hypothetical protein